MDQGALVRSGQSLVSLLDETPARPRFAMWVNFSDTDRWRLWMVPAKGMDDKRKFYETVAETLSRNRDVLPAFDVGVVEYTAESKPMVQAMKDTIRIPGLDSVDMGGNQFDGIFLPDGILRRADL